MAKPLRLNFIFSSFGRLFIAGTKAKGVLKVFSTNETQIKRIKIGVIGKILIEANENENPTTIDEVFYSSEEHIFSSSDILVNDEYDEQSVEYAVPLANNLPPSIVVKEGSISYQLYATMEEEFSDGAIQQVNTQEIIFIANIVNCNTIPKAAKEKRSHTTPVNSCICLQSNNNNDVLQISPRAFVSGDCIKINAQVFNTHSYPMCYVQVALVQKVKLKYESHCVKSEQIVSETKHGCLMPRNIQVWRDELLRVPPLPATTYHKNLIVSYKLRLIPVKQNGNAAQARAVLSVPVLIGNLPLDATLGHFNPLPACESFNNQILPIPKPYQEYAKAEHCIQTVEGSKITPLYITYTTERAMETVELQ